jgi:hypothetical protein
MAARVQLNNFRFSIYIDTDGTVTLTDLPPELREVAEALDPAHQWGATCVISPSLEVEPSTPDVVAREAPSKALNRTASHA